jgi:uncharacterized protein involved in exopolysaccharide biosynthesis
MSSIFEGLKRNFKLKTEGKNTLEDLALNWKRALQITFAGAILGLAYSYTVEPEYLAQAKIIPVSDDLSAKKGISSSITDLAALAGVSIGSGGTTQEYIGYLQSDSLLEDYLNNKKLIPEIISETDKKSLLSFVGAQSTQNQATVGRALKKLHDGLLNISVDKKSGLISLTYKSKNPQHAAEFLNSLIKRANENIRSRDINETTKSIEYLNDEVKRPNQSNDFQVSLYHLIEDQYKKRAVAAGRDEYAYRVVDAARVPEYWERVWPKRRVIVLTASLVALAIFSALLILIKRFAVHEQ